MPVIKTETQANKLDTHRAALCCLWSHTCESDAEEVSEDMHDDSDCLQVGQKGPGERLKVREDLSLLKLSFYMWRR